MAVQNGRDLLIRMDMTGNGSFETVAGLRASRLAFNAETIDVTSTASEGGWRQLLGGAGVRSASISGSGVFRDEATDARARQAFFDGEVPRFQVVIPDFGRVEGPFQISGLEYAGSYNGEATYELSLASAGALSFVPEASVGDEGPDEGGNPGDGTGEAPDGGAGEGEGEGEQP